MKCAEPVNPLQAVYTRRYKSCEDTWFDFAGESQQLSLACDGCLSRGCPVSFPNIDEHVFADVVRLGRVKCFVDKHYAEPLPLATAARIAGLERTYFSAFFRRKTGIGYNSWLRWTRVQRAIELMRQRELTITAIAFEVGFGDLRTFERAFRRCTGSCPKAIQQRIRDQSD